MGNLSDFEKCVLSRRDLWHDNCFRSAIGCAMTTFLLRAVYHGLSSLLSYPWLQNSAGCLPHRHHCLRSGWVRFDLLLVSLGWFTEIVTAIYMAATGTTGAVEVRSAAGDS